MLKSENNIQIIMKTMIISFLVVTMLFIWQGSKGFNLWDEGFLWYGAQRVMLGEVPIRDFMAYEPGRYYWSATLMHLLGDNGIISLRIAVAIFQFLGLFVGVLLIAQSVKKQSKDKFIFLTLSAITLAIWMYPRHKLFDISLSLFLIGTLTYLIRNPVPKRYFITGVGVGLVACFGRNHGVYGAVASLGVILWLNIKGNSVLSFIKKLFLWGSGVMIGFAPIFFMFITVPGFAAAFWDSIRFLFEQKATNLPLPIPWPWSISFSTMPFDSAIRGIFIGIFFIGLFAFGIISVLWVIQMKLKEKPIPPVFVASAFLALPYAHYAFSRADVGHLAQGIFPLLVGCLVFCSTRAYKYKWLFAIALFSMSFECMYVVHPGWQYRSGNQSVAVDVSGNKLLVDPDTASNIALLRQLRDQYAANGQNFVVTPFWPGAYPLLNQRSPMWEIYALFPRTKRFEKQEISRIKTANPRFVFVMDFALDGNNKLRFKNTHPLTHQYILANFALLPSISNSIFQIYKTKNA